MIMVVTPQTDSAKFDKNEEKQNTKEQVTYFLQNVNVNLE